MNLEVFSTCPASNHADLDGYADRVAEVARWSEACGCTGILVYSDNSQLDAWLVSQIVLQHTRSLCPLVALQPIYLHPYTVAKIIASIGSLYRRRIFLNMVAGGFKNDLAALNDTTPHDQRYQRLTEYTRIVTALLDGETVTARGDFYTVDKLKLTPPLPAALAPGIFVSGSSEAGLEAARRLGATAIKYPKPAGEERLVPDPTLDCGIRIGIIARRSAADAWAIAHRRFPVDRKGQMTRQLATKVSDSHWHRELSGRGDSLSQGLYWMVPFENYQTMCPYLVGSYDEVAAELSRYFNAGYHRVILDIPPSEDDLQHSFAALASAAQAVA